MPYHLAIPQYSGESLIQLPPVVKKTIRKVALSEGLHRTTHFAMRLRLEITLTSHMYPSYNGGEGGIRTHSPKRERIYSPPRLSNFAASPYRGGASAPPSRYLCYSPMMFRMCCATAVLSAFALAAASFCSV